MIFAIIISKLILRLSAEVSNTIGFLLTVIRMIFIIDLALVLVEISSESYAKDINVIISLKSIRNFSLCPFSQVLPKSSYHPCELSLNSRVTPSPLHLNSLPELLYIFMVPPDLNHYSISPLLRSHSPHLSSS